MTVGEVVLRPAGPADEPALSGLGGLSASTVRSLARDLARAAPAPPGSAASPLVALLAEVAGDPGVGASERGAEVVGAALGLVQVDEGHVLDIAVAPELRGRGLGRRLLVALAAALHAAGAGELTLEVRAGNLAALALYRSEGFVVEGRRPGYYPDGEDALLLWQRSGPSAANPAAATPAPATAATAATPAPAPSPTRQEVNGC